MQPLPTALFGDATGPVNVYRYFGDHPLSRVKVSLQQHVLSFIITGRKEVDFAQQHIHASDRNALLMKQSNCIMTERALCHHPYQSLLLFFSNEQLQNFLLRHQIRLQPNNREANYFKIEKDAFIEAFIDSLQLLTNMKTEALPVILQSKLDEILLYLIQKYGTTFEQLLGAFAQSERTLSIRSVVEANKFNKLTLNDMAFLCNMSVSTFKRHFIAIYKQSPGRWLKQQKLQRAREILRMGDKSPSELHQLFGYENLSNFSSAFKKEFGVSPSQIAK